VWDASTGSSLNDWFTRENASPERSLVFSADGRRIISAGSGPELIVWDPATGRETFALQGHRQPALTLAAGAGLRLYSAGLDGTVKVWEGLDPGPVAPRANAQPGRATGQRGQAQPTAGSGGAR
jgi:WD40 repeat protein